MIPKRSDTGERISIETTKPRLRVEHEARYRFAGSFVRGKRVLDIACGTGYGSYSLSDLAVSVVGVDISQEAIDEARQDFRRENLRFVCGAAEDPSTAPASAFDVICSFETIEHLGDTERQAYLKNLANWLAEDGTLLLSTPNKRVTSPFSEKPGNTFHVLEFTAKKLTEELSTHFDIVEWYGQRPIRTVWLLKPVRVIIRVIEKILRKDFGFYITGREDVAAVASGYQPRIFVVRCQKCKEPKQGSSRI